MFVKVLGAFVDNDSFVAKKPEYEKEHLFFDRFCFDVVSLFGKNLHVLNIRDIEYILRTAYFTLSHSFGPGNGGMKLLEPKSIQQSPFSAEILQKLNTTINASPLIAASPDLAGLQNPLSSAHGDLVNQQASHMHLRPSPRLNRLVDRSGGSSIMSSTPRVQNTLVLNTNQQTN